MSLRERVGVDRERIRAAANRISRHVRRTPLFSIESGAFGINARITLKLETVQHTGSFKPRGAFNRVLSRNFREGTLVAASGGNHGVAVAYVAKTLGLKAEIFVPTVSSPVKVERLRRYGATVQIGGDVYADALQRSLSRASDPDVLDVHAYDQPEVICGQGTLALELQEQANDLDTVLVAVGGGGLIGGVAAWYAGRARVVAVEPEACPTLHAAREAGTPVDVATGGIAGDSLAARRIGTIPFYLISRYVERAVLVSEDAIRTAMTTLWEDLRIVTEPGGAAAFAALLSGAYVPRAGERVGVVLCGANVDPAELGS